ncbi:MAG: hypothetical protein M1829_006609 [Trizodia sp. TS-e1964]|nr:MAG: hypothetical protein M1829_006609 [Trizodia sp. TS-e1964]
MAFRPLSHHRAIGAAVSAVVLLSPKTAAFAESTEPKGVKKAIYDDPISSTSPPTEAQRPPATASRPTAVRNRPSVTEQLAQHIRRGRLFIHAHAVAAEDAVNNGLTQVLQTEASIASTIASLAPPPESGEKVTAGAAYIVVAGMAGSILSRNRNVLLRASFPLAVGVTTAWMVLPITTRRTADLVWLWEQKVPVVAEWHGRIYSLSQQGWEQGKAGARTAMAFLEEKVQRTRGTTEAWVKKGV